MYPEPTFLQALCQMAPALLIVPAVFAGTGAVMWALGRALGPTSPQRVTLTDDRGQTTSVGEIL